MKAAWGIPGRGLCHASTAAACTHDVFVRTDVEGAVLWAGRADVIRGECRAQVSTRIAQCRACREREIIARCVGEAGCAS